MTNKKFGLAIIVDLEGCAGITRFKETYDRGDDFETARRRMTAELNATVEGAIAGGADPDQIYAVDIHWDGRSLLADEMHPDCKLLRGGRFPALRAKVYSKVQAVAYLGLYAPAGGDGGVMAHTQDFHIQHLKINGVLWGDAVLECRVAEMKSGDASGAIPIFAAGDQHALAAFTQFYPKVGTVTTKEALDASSAICPHPSKINAKISELMKEVCTKFAADRRAFSPTSSMNAAEELTATISFSTSEMADAVSALYPGVSRSSSHEVKRTFLPSETTALEVANFLVGATLISRAADDGRGGAE